MYSVDAYFSSLQKHGEELCGDHVEKVILPDSTIFVLSDGLGSGVKANILATMTSKIAATMLKEGATLAETLDTLAHTLPVCSVRKLAYSTFTIIQVYYSGSVYIAEFDNPSVFAYQNQNFIEIKKEESVINGKHIAESAFAIQEGCRIIAVSDGIIHAGVGRMLDLGWQWKNVKRYIPTLFSKINSAKGITENLLKVSNILYENCPGDDTTVLSICLKPRKPVNLFVGPPKNTSDDSACVNQFLRRDGLKIVCGGTTASIFSQAMEKELQVDMDTMTKYIPPIAKIDGLDLVTEGVITLREVIDLLKAYQTDANGIYDRLEENNGAAKLARILIEDSSRVHITFGLAENPVHQKNDYADINLNIKSKQVNDIADLLLSMNREVEVDCV